MYVREDFILVKVGRHFFRGLRSKMPQLGLSKSVPSHPQFALEDGCPKRTLPAHPLPLTMEKNLRQSY